jgi:hypothetical protein
MQPSHLLCCKHHTVLHYHMVVCSMLHLLSITAYLCDWIVCLACVNAVEAEHLAVFSSSLAAVRIKQAASCTVSLLNCTPVQQQAHGQCISTLRHNCCCRHRMHHYTRHCATQGSTSAYCQVICLACLHVPHRYYFRKLLDPVCMHFACLPASPGLLRLLADI